MQINFYTSPKDEQMLVDHIYRQDGYFVVYKSGKQSTYPVIADVSLPPSRRSGVGPDHVISEYRRLRISKTSICQVPPSRWDRKRPVFKREQLHGERGFQFEMIEFTRSYSDGLKLYPGRLWLNGLEDETIRFYQKLCRYVRKSFEKNKTGWWVGPTTDEYCRTETLEKANFAFATYSLQSDAE